MIELSNLIDFFIHLDRYVGEIIREYGIFTYLILFLIIFLETGLVIAPFLPGDSLIFIVGTFAAQGSLNIILAFLIFSAAAIIGDSVNYAIGNYFGERAIYKIKFIRKRNYLERTKEFYARHGGKTIILARFIPIIRTFAPFVAGVGKMNYIRFASFNVVGGIIWVGLFVFSGYYFGAIPFVKNNLTLFVLLIILLSVFPPIIRYIAGKRK